jgi:hypothetical protein
MTHNQLTKNTYEMVKDAMRAIIDTNNTVFIKSLDERYDYNDKLFLEIVQEIKYKEHSGSSLIFTLKLCQFYLNNKEEWEKLLKYYEL